IAAALVGCGYRRDYRSGRVSWIGGRICGPGRRTDRLDRLVRIGKEASMASAAPHDPPFRADHVGSLLRPPQLLKARAECAGGRISQEELRRIEDAAIREVVSFQEQAGLQSITDGEYRREIFYSDFYF